MKVQVVKKQNQLLQLELIRNTYILITKNDFISKFTTENIYDDFIKLSKGNLYKLAGALYIKISHKKNFNLVEEVFKKKSFIFNYFYAYETIITFDDLINCVPFVYKTKRVALYGARKANLQALFYVKIITIKFMQKLLPILVIYFVTKKNILFFLNFDIFSKLAIVEKMLLYLEKELSMVLKKTLFLPLRPILLFLPYPLIETKLVMFEKGNIWFLNIDLTQITFKLSFLEENIITLLYNIFTNNIQINQLKLTVMINDIITKEPFYIDLVTMVQTVNNQHMSLDQIEYNVIKAIKKYNKIGLEAYYTLSDCYKLIVQVNTFIPIQLNVDEKVKTFRIRRSFRPPANQDLDEYHKYILDQEFFIEDEYDNWTNYIKS